MPEAAHQEQPRASNARSQGQPSSGASGRRRSPRRRRRRASGPDAGAPAPQPAVPAAKAHEIGTQEAGAQETGPAPSSPVPAFAPEIQPAASTPAAAAQPSRGVVVLAIGLPGSGKSTWFKRRGVTPLSSDLLRTVLFDDITEQRYQHLVFSTLRSILRARLIARMPWNYLDATNLSPRERRHWIQMAREFGYEVHAVFFEVPVELCMERNHRRQRMVPEDIMRNMAARLRPPKFDEGFSKITVVRVKQSDEEPSTA
ncbi:MAG: ATP-binding protein [Acidobacteria bacterium]|nr:ATP-binding protein [Acidobacteriota bacterium]